MSPAEHHVVDNDPRLRMQLVNADSGRTAAQMDTAYEYIHEKTRAPFERGLRKRARAIGKLIWYSNIGRDHVQHREFRRAGERVRQAGGNYLELQGGNQEEYNQEMGALVERFTDELLDPGETNTEMDPILAQKLTLAILQYAAIDGDPDVGMPALEQQVNDFLHDAGPRMMSYGHNIFEVAKNARLARIHGETMARIEKAISGRYGIARAGQRTTHQREIADVTLNLAQRPLEFLNRNGFTYANETTAGTGLIVGLTIAKLAVKRTVSAVTTVVGFGVGAGAIAGVRTWREEGRRRRFAMREWAAGKKTPTTQDSPRLQRLEETRYDSVHASKLYDRLDAAINDINPQDPETLSAALDIIAEVHARRSLSNELNIDLIEYSAGVQIERERTLLYKRLDEAIEALQRTYENINDSGPFPARHGPRVLTPEVPVTNIHVRSMVEARMHALRANGRASIWDELVDDIHQQDAEFRNHRLRRAAILGGVAMLSGGLVGITFQETIGQAFTGAHGLLSENAHGTHTYAAHIFRNTSRHGFAEANQHTLYPGLGRTEVKFSDGMVVDFHPGHSRLLDKGGNVIFNHLTFNRQGDLSAQSIYDLRSKGFEITQGAHAYHDALGSGVRHISEIHAPKEFATNIELPGVLPVYYMRGLEARNQGRRWENLPSTRTETGNMSDVYLRSLDKTKGDLVDRMADKLNNDPRNEGRTIARPKAVIIIPADTSKDSRSIFDTLSQYKNQTEKDFEIVVFVPKRSNRANRTVEEIERIQRNLNKQGRTLNRRHRNNLKIRIVEEVMPAERLSSRRVREAITDAVIADLRKRNVNLDETLLIYNGADTRSVDPRYIKTVIEEMSREPALDILVGYNGRVRGPDPARRPVFEKRTQRISRVVERFVRRRPNYVGSTKANIVLRPRAYVTPTRRRIEPGYIEYNSQIGLMLK